jgi:hypothetical protein
MVLKGIKIKITNIALEFRIKADVGSVISNADRY